MTVKVNYDSQTTLVLGYYPDSINYSSIPEPFIEISDEEHQQNLSKQMCVIDGVCQEYVKPLNIQLQELKKVKIDQLAKNREFKAEKSSVEYNGKTYANSQNARIAINDARQSMTNSSPAVSYFTYPTDENGNLIPEQREIVEFFKTDFTTLADLIRNNERNLREQEIDLIAEINACITIEELNAINIDL